MEIFFLFGTKESSTERKKKKSKVIIMNQRSLQNASPERHKEKKTPSLPFRAQWCQRWRLMVGTQVSHWSNMPSFQKLLKRETCQPWCSAAVRGWRFARKGFSSEGTWDEVESSQGRVFGICQEAHGSFTERLTYVKVATWLQELQNPFPP